MRELKYYFENETNSIFDNLSENYNISTKIHHLPINFIQWNIQYALEQIIIDGNKPQT